jgi:hypothetical protein
MNRHFQNTWVVKLPWGVKTHYWGHFGHFHDVYIKYIFAKHFAFNFGFHFWCLNLII